jgi:hypothetical protein
MGKFSRIPRGINKLHIQRAISEINRTQIPIRRRPRTQVLVIAGHKYPVKYVVSLACKYATGNALPSSAFHANNDAKPFLESLGYNVVGLAAAAKPVIAAEDDESSSPEGREVYRIHRRLERDGAIPRKAKALRLQSTGKLECEVCKFDFAQTYGTIGHGFIEAHHTLPVSKIRGKSKTKISDLALVCSNCHRMLHHEKEMDVAKLAKVLTKQRKQRTTA